MTILKDSLIYLGGEIAAKAMPFLLLPYLTRTLGAEGFGILSYWQTAAALLLIVSGMSQDGALTRYFYVYGRRNLGNIMLAGCSYTLGITALGLLYAWRAHSWTAAFAAASAAAQSLFAAQLALRQCQKQAKAYALLQICAAASATLLTVLLLELSRTAAVEKRFAALLLAYALITALAAWAMRRKGYGRATRLRLRRSAAYLLGFGLPLLPHHAGGYIKSWLDRILIYRYYPAAALGIYSAGYQLAAVLSVLLMAVNKATLPYYYQALKSGRMTAATVRRWALAALALAPLPALAAWLLPQNLFRLILGAEYGGSKYYACLFLIGFGLSMPYYLLVNYLFYHARNRRIALISTLSAAAYLVILLPAARMGIQTVPFAMIAANILILPLLFRQVGTIGTSGR